MNHPIINLLDNDQQRAHWLTKMGIRNADRARTNLLAIAKSGMTIDLVGQLLDQCDKHLPQISDPDMALNNLERFILGSRSPLAVGTFLERDETAIPILLTLFSVSQYLSDLLIQDRESYDALRLSEGQLFSRDVLTSELTGLVLGAKDAKHAMALMRRFKHRETLRIAFGDLVACQRMVDITQQISFLADSVCQAAFEFCYKQLVSKWGVPRLEDGLPCQFVIMAIGKLGGLELNYSSDIDLVMVYQSEGKCDSSRSTSNAEFFELLTAQISRLLSEVTREGAAYRVDLRLRPNGSKGTACNSFDQMVRYYELKGRTWERQALIKMRPIAGDLALGDQLVETLEPWIYHRRLNRLDISEIKALKRKIERRAEVEGVDHSNVKTGRGGIRDVEFAIQFMQLLYGSRSAQVRGVNTLTSIEQLQLAGCLTLDEEALLSQNYIWLRKLEHRLQIMFDLQTHTLPESHEELQKVAMRMGYVSEPGLSALEKFNQSLAKTTEVNRRILDHLLHDAFSDDENEEVPIEADLVLDEGPDETLIQSVFQKHGFADPKKAFRNLTDIADESTPFLSPHRCRHFLAAIAAKLLQEIANTPDPDQTLNLLAGVSDKIGGQRRPLGALPSSHSFLETVLFECVLPAII